MHILRNITAEQQGIKHIFSLKTTKEYLNANKSLMRLTKV